MDCYTSLLVIALSPDVVGCIYLYVVAFDLTVEKRFNFNLVTDEAMINALFVEWLSMVCVV